MQWGMPPPSAYTSFESLLFFQSLAALGSHPINFIAISDSLRNNSFIRQHAAFDPDRLSPEALEQLYSTLIQDAVDPNVTLATSSCNGRSEAPVAGNPKKRKISNSHHGDLVDVSHSKVILDLVPRLYARYKDLITREIRNEEHRFIEINDEIKRLQNEEQDPRASAALDGVVAQSLIMERGRASVHVDSKTARPAQQPTWVADAQQTASTLDFGMKEPWASESPSAGSSQQRVATVPPKSVHEGHSNRLQTARLPHELPRQTPHPIPVAPLTEPPTNAKAVPVQQQLATGSQYMSVSETPAKKQHIPQSRLYPEQGMRGGSQTLHPIMPQPVDSVWRTSELQQSAKPDTGSLHQVGYFPPVVPSTPGHPAPPYNSANISHVRRHMTPTPAIETTPPGTKSVQLPPVIETRRSHTPWKELPRLSIPGRPSSPIRPRQEDISPISERSLSARPFEAATEGTEHRYRKCQAPGESEDLIVSSTDVDNRASKRTEPDKLGLATKKKRDESVLSSRGRRPAVSHEEPSSLDALGGILKREAADAQTDIPKEMMSSQRAVPDRKGGVATAQLSRRTGRSHSKRKRSITETLELEPAQPESSRVDPNQYVLCARNFPRTGAPIMNDVTTHKYASIFTKPLTEREAPGYRDLIYRPQDLKSIKSCISQGSKALSAASETTSTPTADGEPGAPSGGSQSKNSVLILRKSEDIVPPKAIVNSAQLEKELIRMFANAVMYNPTPQRGFGLAFPMISDDGTEARPPAPEVDEGGIVSDAMEMFNDVEKAVTRWRAAERTSDELANKSIMSARRRSVGDTHTDSTDDNKA